VQAASCLSVLLCRLGLAVTVVQVGAVLDIKPTFDAYMNDAWRVRKEVRSSPRRRNFETLFTLAWLACRACSACQGWSQTLYINLFY
jgi:hypothetical protein